MDLNNVKVVCVAYEHLKVGQEFIETERAAIGRKRRTVIVMKTETYWVEVKVIDGPGRNRTVRIWNKQLCDPERWHFIDPGNAETVLM
jgi:hypothetical protein